MLKLIIGDVDEAPVFTMDYYIMDVYENAPAGTEVGMVTAQDPDSTRSKSGKFPNRVVLVHRVLMYILQFLYISANVSASSHQGCALFRIELRLSFKL